MALTLVTLKTYLDEAEKARHSLAMGDKVVTISNIDGGSSTYNQTSMRQLTAYISYLEDKIAGLEGTKRRTAIEFRF